eukprot:7472995-Karenia_brevis.AAC.1
MQDGTMNGMSYAAPAACLPKNLDNVTPEMRVMLKFMQEQNQSMVGALHTSLGHLGHDLFAMANAV